MSVMGDVDRLRVELAGLQAENRRLRKMTSNGKEGRIAHRAGLDAKQIIGWRFSGYSVARRACRGYGMPERRWMWAVSVLKFAGVLHLQAAAVDDFAINDISEALTAVDKALARVERDGLGPLIFRLPRGRVVTPRG